MGKTFPISCLALTISTALAGPASAAVIICTGANCVDVDENVLVNGASNAPTITGSTNNSGVGVTFASSTDPLLNGDANGQADVSSADGLLNSLMFSIESGYSFATALFDLVPISGNNPNDPLTNLKADTVTISYYTPGLGTQSQTINTNGTNFLGIYGTAGERFTGAGFSSDPITDGISDFRHVRLGGVELLDPMQSGVPEPGIWALVLIGFGFIGWAMRRKNSEQTQLRFAF